MKQDPSDELAAEIKGLQEHVAELERALADHKRTREALQESEARAHAFLESASEGVLIVNRGGLIVSLNAKIEEMFGYGRDELIGRPLEVLVPVRLREGHVAHREDYFADPRVRPMGQGFDLAGRRKDGSEFPVEISLSFVDTQDGLQVMAFITDITARKQAEETLRRSEARARAYLEAASEGVVIVGSDGRILSINARLEQMFGYGRDELLGQPLELLVPERIQEMHVHHRAGYFAGPRVRPMGQGLDLSGAERTVRSSRWRSA